MRALIYKAHPDAIIPEQKSVEAAGLDLCCLEDFSIFPGQRVVVSTGLVVQPPPGHHVEVLARSGLAYKHGITVTNAVGLIDRDYSGPKDVINVMLYMVPAVIPYGGTYSFDGAAPPVIFKKGDRIAQLVFRKTEMFQFEVVEQAPSTIDRGGLGSTGVSK